MKPVRALALCFGGVLGLGATSAVAAPGQPGSVIAWGRYYDGAAFAPVVVPSGLTNVLSVAGGSGHSVALFLDGTVTAWGYNYFGQTNVPVGLANVTSIACGQYFSLALRADGTVVAWGQYYDGAEYSPVYVPAGLTNVVEIAAGAGHGMARERDGTVVAWGDDSYGQTDVPTSLSNVVAIAAGERSSLALQADGTVIVWGQFFNGAAYVPAVAPALTNVTALALGAGHGLAVETNGAVVGWGYSPFGQINVPAGLTNAVAIAAGENYSLALRDDASIFAWGSNANGQTNLPVTATNVVQIAAGYYHGLALVAQGPIVWSNAVPSLFLSQGQSATLKVTVATHGPFGTQWFLNGVPLPGANGTNLLVSDFALNNSGVYDVLVSNRFGSVTRSIAVLRLTNSPLVLVDGADLGGGTVTQVDSVQVAMSSSFDPGANIYYTLDGTAPDFTATQYTGPLTLTDSAVVRAIAYNFAYSDSAEAAPITVQVWPTYPLQVEIAGGGTVDVSPFPYTDDRYLSNSTAVLTANPDAGWSFMGWSGAAAVDTNMGMVLIDGPTEVQAVFGTSLNLYTNGQGDILADPPTGPYPYGTTVRLTALPRPGFYFFGWAGAAGGSQNPLCIQATNAAGITGLFGVLKTNQVALTVFASGDGQVESIPNQVVFTNGDTVTLTASPGTNSAFAGWSGDVYGMTNPLVLQLNTSVTLTANFIFIPPTNPPSIIQQPTSATLSPGSPAVLGVQASGQPPLLYQWRFNGVPLPDQTNVDLVLPSLVSSQAGQYDVVVSGPAGTVTSNPVLLGLFSLQAPASSQGSLPLLILDSAPGSHYLLEFTDDPALGTWQMLSQVTLQSGRAYYIDQPASEHSQRFYRAAPQ